MALQTWWIYATAVFLISATPGPNMLHVMARSVDVGARRSLIAMAGLMSAVLLCLLASVAGLGALLKAMPHLFDALRIAGAAYLLYLGYRAWTSPVATSGVTPDMPAMPRMRAMSAIALYRAGLLTGLSNPKLIIFAAAFFPQFIDPRAAFAPQLAILLATFVAIEGFWYGVYALGGLRLARWLGPAHRQRLFNRATGGLFMLFGGLLMARSA